MRLWACFIVVFGLLQSGAATTLANTPKVLTPAREDYSEALRAIENQRWDEYEKLRSGLDTYPLAIYLDYFKLTSNLQRVRPKDARRFISLSEDTPLPNRFLAAYLRQAGKAHRWGDFLAVMPTEPNAVDLKCYYFRAQLAAGDKLAAWEGAERLWVHGRSRPDECDPLFAAWLKAGELSDPVVWARMLKAFDEGQRTLLGYVARKGSAQLKPWADKLQAVYLKPDRIRRHSLPAKSAYSADIAGHGIIRLARYNPEKALQEWRYYNTLLSFSEAQAQPVEHAIALQSLFAKTEAHIPWLDEVLPRLANDKLVEIRLRWAVEERDWAAVTSNLAFLSPKRAEDASWRYWAAVAEEARGELESALAAFASVASERGYYGFLAADRLGQRYRFNNRPLMLEAEQAYPLRQLAGVQRVEELYFHDEEQLAHSEWFNMLQSVEAKQSEGLAWLASEQGWHRMSIDAANKAKAWDRLELRFPMPYQETFTHYAAVTRVPSTELMAIARRESAFFPEARSPVGARGLMQLMPATGKQVASKLGKRHSNSDLYAVEHNVLLGSAYYRQLLDRYNGNRVFALTAYNAGPHRVDRWRNKAGEGLSVEEWIASIPYKETRNYVQAVLSYTVVFHHLQGEERSLLTPQELQAEY